ncbi:hypothetical protein BH23ACT11_BH23ACT11_06960 [soil metagenome]
MVDRLSYFWGLFDSVEAATVEEAEKRVDFEPSAVPEAVSRSPASPSSRSGSPRG